MSIPEFCPACEKKLPELEGSNFCPFCGYMLTGEPPRETEVPPSEAPVQDPVEAPHPPADPQHAGIPWEDSPELGIIERLTQTWSGVLFNTVNFFRQMTVKESIMPAFVYGFLFRMAGTIFSAFWAQTQFQERPDNYEDMPEFLQQLYDYIASNPDAINPMSQIIFAPLFIIFSMIIVPGILHLILIMFGWAKENFVSTFRVTAYASSAALFQAIPIIGDLIFSIWGMLLTAIGLRERHSLSIGQTVLVMVLPLLACCGLILAFISMVVAVAVGA